MKKELTTSAQQLTVANFVLKPDGLLAVGSPSFDDWQKVGDFIKKSSESVHFWIGDWLNYGEMQWGETYRQAVEAFGFNIQTLRNDKWVALRIPRERRKKELSFSHHQEVADLEEEDQNTLLTEAVEKSLGRNDFRKYVKEWNTAGTSQEIKVSGRPDTLSGTNELKAKDILFNVDLLLASIEACDFDNLSPSLRDEVLKKLDPISKRIDGLFMNYKDEV